MSVSERVEYVLYLVGVPVRSLRSEGNPPKWRDIGRMEDWDVGVCGCRPRAPFEKPQRTLPMTTAAVIVAGCLAVLL